MDMQERPHGGVEWNRKIWAEEKLWQQEKAGEAWSSYPSVPKVNGRILTSSREMWDEYLWPLLAPHVPASPRVLEVAPGYGRCTSFLLGICREMVVVDLCENCVVHCRERFGDDPRLTCHVNDGKALPMVADASVDLVFSWDSFVHINRVVTRGYVREFGRVLAPGGAGFIHHSNAGAEDQEKQLGLRSDMTAEHMTEFCSENGLTVIYQKKHYPLDNGGFNDCVTMFRR